MSTKSYCHSFNYCFSLSYNLYIKLVHCSVFRFQGVIKESFIDSNGLFVIQELPLLSCCVGVFQRGGGCFSLIFGGKGHPYVAQVVFKMVLVFWSTTGHDDAALFVVDEPEGVVFVEQLAGVVRALAALYTCWLCLRPPAS